MTPYRERFEEPAPPRRGLDPWILALLFAWVGDFWTLGNGIVSRRNVEGELAFAGLLAATSLVVIALRLRDRRRHSSAKDRTTSARTSTPSPH
jgi:hypothetical protein